jgi:hypothetical protein
MWQLFQRLKHELGNGRAIANACAEREATQLLAARIDALAHVVPTAA